MSKVQRTVPEIRSFWEILGNEKVRLLKTGYNYFIGLSMAGFYYIILPSLLYPLYTYLPYKNQYVLVLIGFPLSISVYVVIFQTLMNIVYKMKHPYFEQYKILKNPWPWETNPVLYNQEYKKFFTIATAGNVMIIPFLYPLLHFDLIHFKTDLESFPSTSEIFIQILFFIFVFETIFY